MIKQFKRYIKENNLLSENDTVILAVSGGVDSMVMADLFTKADNYNLVIAHCNFNLRGNESDLDTKLVEEYAKQNSITFEKIYFNTKEYAKQNSLSTQMAARELRHNWFLELIEKHNACKIAIAHNLNDNAETFLINLSRGTGIKGLTGIKNNNIIIRPVIFASREEIEAYAESNSVRYRNDSTNSKTIYRRNHIRHKVIPELAKSNPSVLHAINTTIQNLTQVQDIYDEYIKNALDQLVTHTNDFEKVKITDLVTKTSFETIVYEWLTPHGFNKDQIHDIVKSVHTESGKRFFSDEKCLFKEQEYLSLQKNVTENTHTVINKFDPDAVYNNLTFEKKDIKELKSLKTDSNTAIVDFDKIKFPLSVQNWEKGDSFSPFGMKGRKKVSDFLIDNKVPVSLKNNVLTLKSDNKIVWLIGHRIDNNFKITKDSNVALIIKKIDINQ